MEKQKRSANKALMPIILRISLLLLVAAALLSGHILAKYSMKKDSDKLYVAKSFYFESDLLGDPSGAVPQYTLQAGVDTIEFFLMNYPDELRTSEVDIECEVTLSGESVSDKKNITLASSENDKKDKEKVSFTGLAPGTYVVTATAVSPYSSTLQAKFTIVGITEGIRYSVNDAEKSPNLKVTVTTTDYSGNIIISWPESVLPDNTDPLLSLAAGQSCTVKVEKHSEYTFHFFKTDPNGNYINNITVTTETAQQ